MEIILKRENYFDKEKYLKNYIEEKIIDGLVLQIRNQNIPKEHREIIAQLYKHSMFAPKKIVEGDIETLKNRSSNIKRLGQGDEGIVELFFKEIDGTCIKRKYAIGDRKEQREGLENNRSYTKEFNFQITTFDLKIKCPMPFMHIKILVKNENEEKIESLSTEFLIMEAIEGETLLEFSPEKIKNISALQTAFKKLKLDLGTLHLNNIYHGDLSLKNMMIVEYFKKNKVAYDIYIIDFGKAYSATKDMFSDEQLPWAYTDNELYQHAYNKFFR